MWIGRTLWSGMGTWRRRRVGIQGWILGLDSRSPGGTGKDSAEVWFKKV